MEYQPLDENEKDGLDEDQKKLQNSFKLVDFDKESAQIDQSYYELDGEQSLDFVSVNSEVKKFAEREFIDKKMSEQDKEIELCFKGMEKVSPIVYLEGIQTTSQTSFKLSDDAIVLIDNNTSLKMISTVDQKLDKLSYESYQKVEYNVYIAQLILKEKNLSDVITNYDKEKMAVTHLLSSFDKKEIILCTKHGQIKILNPETFEELQKFENQDESAIVDITLKVNFFAVAHKNGKIFIYKKADEKSAYALVQIKRDDKKKHYMPEEYKEEILAIQFSLVSDHMIVILKSPKEDAPLEKQLLLYNQRYQFLNPEQKPEKLIAKEDDALTLKRYFDFAPEVFIMRVLNQKGFKVFTLDKFEKTCETEKITSVPTNLLTFLPDKKTVLILDEKEVFLLSLDGVPIKNLSGDDKNSCFLIAPLGITDSFQLISLPDCTTLFTFKENLYNQPKFFYKEENCNLFSPKITGPDSRTFFIEMQDNKPKFKNVQFVTQNQKIIVCYENEQKVTELYDVITHKLLRKLPNTRVITCDKDSKWLYCSYDQQGEEKVNKTVRINIEEVKEGQKKIPPTFESEEIYHQIFDEIQVTKDNEILYCKGSGELGYALYKINLNTKTLVDFLPIREKFSFQMSNEEQWIIVATEEMLMQVSLGVKEQINPDDQNMYQIVRNQKMERKERMPIYEGLTDQICFDPKDKYFIVGGSESKDLNMYQLEDLSKFNVLETHTSKNNWCYFISSNRCLTIGNGDNLMICWDTSDCQLWKRVFSVEKQVNPLTGWNQKLTAINMNNHTYVWNEYLTHELTDDVQALQGEEVRLEWISGPLNKLFWLMSDHYEKCGKNGKEQLLPHLMKNVIHPYGYTFFSWLAYQDKTDIMKNIIEYNDVKYIRDHYGNAPLLYALKRNSSEKVTWILDFINNQTKITKSPKLFKQISNSELILLLRLGPVSLVPFFESAIMPIEENLCTVAKKIDEDNPSYMMVDPLKARYKEAEQILCEQGVDESEKFSVEFVQAVIPLNFEVGSWESVDFQEALDECPNDKVFNTEYMKAVINYKARLVAPLVYFLLAMQVLFTLCITIHAYLPGRRFMVWLNLGWVIYLFLLEFLIWHQNDFSFRFNHMMNIVIIIMVAVYSVWILHEVNEFVDTMLPFINLLCWLQMIMQLKQFELIRGFVKVFMKTIEALTGFIAFLLVMLLAFSTTYNVIIKAHERKERIYEYESKENMANVTKGTYSGLYNEEFYTQRNLTNKITDDLSAIIYAVYDTYGTMVTGNYNEDEKLGAEFTFIIFIVAVILLANVILLNIIVAIMSDSYVEVMTSMAERSYYEQSNSILQHERMMFWKRFSGQKTCLVWLNYLDVVDNTWKSQVEAITSAVKNTFKNVLVEFEKTEVKLLGVLADQIDKADVGLNDKLDKNAAKVTNYMDKQAQDLASVKQNLEQTAIKNQDEQIAKLAEEISKEKEELANARANFDQKIETHEQGINEMNTNLSKEMSKANEDVKGTLTKNLEEQTSKLSDLSTNIDKKLTDQEKDLVGMKSELTSELDSAQNDIKSTFSKQSENQESELKNIQSDIDKKMDSQLAAQEGMMKELDSEISKSSSDVTKTMESKADEQDNQISSIGANLSSEINKDKADIQQYSSRDTSVKTIESVQSTLTKEIVAQKENIKKQVLDSAQSQFNLAQEHLTTQIDKQQVELKQVKDYLSEEIVKQQAETKSHLTSKMESQLKEVKSRLDEQMKKKESELNDMKFELSNMITDQNMNLSAQMTDVTQQVNGLKESQNQITGQLDELFNILQSLS